MKPLQASDLTPHQKEVGNSINSLQYLYLRSLGVLNCFDFSVSRFNLPNSHHDLLAAVQREIKK